MNFRNVFRTFLVGCIMVWSMLPAGAVDEFSVTLRLQNATAKSITIFVVPEAVGFHDLSYLRPYEVVDGRGLPVVIAPGRWMQVVVRGSVCSYDVVDAFADGSFEVHPDVMLCRRSVMTL